MLHEIEEAEKVWNSEDLEQEHLRLLEQLKSRNKPIPNTQYKLDLLQLRKSAYFLIPGI
jgi:hypothetical protein